MDDGDADDDSSFPRRQPISQPVVVLNHYMVPISGPAADFEVAYHLRLLSVQYMSNTNAADYFRQFGAGDGDVEDNDDNDNDNASEESPLYSVENSDTAVDMDAFLDGDKMYRPRKISAATAVVRQTTAAQILRYLKTRRSKLP
jgi:hypothetical protein